MSDETNKVVVVSVPPEDWAGMCETFCQKCGQLRLWLRREFPTSCGNCGEPKPVVGSLGGTTLPQLRELWRAKKR